MRHGLAICAALAICCAAVGAQPPTLALQPIATPAGANSSVPQMTAAGDRVVLSWVERAGKTSTLK